MNSLGSGGTAVIRKLFAGLKSARDMDALKTSHPSLKLILSVRLSGTSPELTNVTEGPEAVVRRAEFAEKVTRWLQEYNFDGVELDWDRLPLKFKAVYVDLAKVHRENHNIFFWKLYKSLEPNFMPCCSLPWDLFNDVYSGFHNLMCN